MCTAKQNPLIFDIQKGTCVDGPGLRTAIFVKGCPLSCKWCHNPESQKTCKQRMYYPEKCTLCLKCIECCPTAALSVNSQNGGIVCDAKKCVLCRKCESVCPTRATSVCGYTSTVDSLCNIIAKDRIFYETSGGGVTISGGECLLFSEFVFQLLKKCKDMKISTAVDTAGGVPWHNFEQVLPVTDLFLYDIKCISKERHRKYVGVGNEQIISNYLKLIKLKKDIIVRIPLIGGFNSDKEEFMKIANFLHKNPPKKIEILPYHTLGESKYAALGLTAPTEFEIPAPNLLDEYKKLLNDVFSQKS